jgi:nicotinate-nucleotide pyrophosphorylase (carboxylating)
MMPLNSTESAAAEALIDLALREDLADKGDRTTLALIPPDLPGAAYFVARKPGILAGVPVAEKVFRAVDPAVTFQPLREDGSRLMPGDRIAKISGPMRGILVGERTALNFMQRLSGIATQTRRYVVQVAGISVTLLDTRKTTPGWRLLEKYAVRCGGAANHRIGLFDGILIKDNHLAAVRGHGSKPDAVRQAIRLARAAEPNLTIEVEVEDLDQLDAALDEKPEIVLLDNMSQDTLREAVRRRNATAPAVLLEASGGVTLETVRAIAETGVDRISIGALTHSAVALDIALDYESSSAIG